MNEKFKKEIKPDNLIKSNSFSEFVKKNKKELTMGIVAVELATAAFLPGHAIASERNNPPKPEIPNAEVVNGYVSPPERIESEQKEDNSSALPAGIAAAFGAGLGASLARRRREDF